MTYVAVLEPIGFGDCPNRKNDSTQSSSIGLSIILAASTTQKCPSALKIYPLSTPKVTLPNLFSV